MGAPQPAEEEKFCDLAWGLFGILCGARSTEKKTGCSD